MANINVSMEDVRVMAAQKGEIELENIALKRYVRELEAKLAALTAPVQEVPSDDVTDRNGAKPEAPVKRVK